METYGTEGHGHDADGNYRYTFDPNAGPRLLGQVVWFGQNYWYVTKVHRCTFGLGYGYLIAQLPLWETPRYIEFEGIKFPLWTESELLRRMAEMDVSLYKLLTSVPN